MTKEHAPQVCGRRLFSAWEKERVLEKTNFRCAKCGKTLNVHTATMDHVLPVEKGGLNDEYNLVAMCEGCNLDKGNYCYSVTDYYNYILPEYRDKYRKYHEFAMYDIWQSSLLGYDAVLFKVYPPKQQYMLAQMRKRRTNVKKLDDMARRLGINFSLEKAFEGDAEKIMELIAQNHSCLNEKDACHMGFYENSYQVADDIVNGECYILCRAGSREIHGAFMFRKVTDDDFPIMQLKNITENTGLHVKYIMTAAVVDRCTCSAYNDVMDHIAHCFVAMRAVPLYFNILSYVFAKKNNCILMPYEFDKRSGSLEFMSERCIAEMAGELARQKAANVGDLNEGEMELFTDAMVRYPDRKSLLLSSEPGIKELFEKHPKLLEHFRPEEMEDYGKGFKKEK